MPGNEFGDRVHNFFEQENTFQGQPEPQVVEGNWPVMSNNFWIGSQRQADALHLNTTYNLQNSDIDRGQGSYPFPVTQGLNFAQSNVRADFSKKQSLNEQPYLNGYVFGNQFHLSRQNEANFLAADTDSEPHHAITSRGFSVHELQQGSGMENGAKTLLRSETSVLSVSLDLFGGQQQMSHHHSSMLQPVQHQHPGINDMQQQQQQQQLMIRKMQDLQRQQQFQPLEIRQQNHIDQVSAFTKQASGSLSSPIDGNPVSDLQQYPWTTEVGANWMNRGSPSMQGTSTGLVFPPNLGQTQHLVDLVPQSVDQSLYGIPVSGTRGLNVNQYSHKVTDRSPMLQMSTSSNTLQGNRNFFADQVGLNDEDSVTKQKFQNENMSGRTSNQSLYTEPRNMGSLQQVNSIQRNSPHDLLGGQELTIRPETSSEKSRRPAVASSNEVALDPAEEKILFGSDDNIWAAFGNTANIPGESGNLFDNGESLNGFPSINSGSWSALMQSAVAETSSNDMIPQEEWSGLIFHNVNGSSVNQSSSVHHNNVKQQSSLVDDKTRMPSAPSPGSIPPSGDNNVNNVTGLNLLGHRFLNEPGQRLPNELSERFVSLEEVNKWSNYIPPQKSLAEDSQIYRDTSQNSPVAGMSAMKISSPWAQHQSGSEQQSNGRNSLVSMPTGGDRGLNVHQAEKSQNSKGNQFRVIKGEVVGGTLRKSNSVSRSATELGPAKQSIGNPGTNNVILSLNDAASVANSNSIGVADETNPFFHNSNKINQWKNSNSSKIYQGGKDLGRTLHQAMEHNQGLDSLSSCEKEEVTRCEMENYDMKENSNDSHRSNLSGHTSCGFRETGSGASDSKSLPPTNQKLTNPLSRKISVPRKFQYHPMGNSDEDAEPSHHLKQSTNLQAMAQSNSYLDQSNFMVQYPRNSKVNEQGQSSKLQKHNKVMNEELPHVGLPGYAPTISVSYSPLDSFTPGTVSSSGQNMLELLPKADHSKGHGDMMHLSSEGKVSAQLPEAEKVDGTAGFFQQNQSSVYQGFGLQLGPPSLQWGQIPDHSASSQKAQSTVNTMPISHAVAEMGEKGQRMVPTSTIQSSSLKFPNGEFQAELKNNRPAVPPRHTGSDERHRNFQEAFSSGSPHVSQLQNQQVMRSSGKIMMNQHADSSFSSDVSNNMQRGSMETVFSDTLGDVQKANRMTSRGMTQQAGPNDTHERGQTSTASARDPLHASQHFSMHGISYQGSPLNASHNLTTNVYANQQSLGTQYHKASSPFSDLTQPNTGESSSAPLTQDSLNVCKGGDLSSDVRSIYVNSLGVVDGEEHKLTESAGQSLSSVRIDTSNKNHSADSPVDLFSAQKNIEAFGRSLKPNSFSHQNHASLNQMKALKDAGTDPSCRISKRMKGPDDCLDFDRVASTAGQQNNRSLVLGDSLDSSTGVPSDDLTMPSFLLEADALQMNLSQHGNVASWDIMSRGANVTHSNSSTDYIIVRAKYPEASPEMAPSWFNQYDTFKNGHMLHSYNPHKLIPSKSGELGKSPSVMDTLDSEEKAINAPRDACQVNTTHQTSTSTFVNAPLSSSLSYELNATAQNLVISRPKKRRTATSQLQPWHKEIADGSQNLSSLSVAETVWSQVANRLKEKVDDDAELIEVGPSFLRSKRRLILTTQLMQQLFYPPSAAILSADASVECESVAYAVSRIVLGNVCSAVFHPSGLDLPHDSLELLSAEGKPSERNVARYSGKVMEGLMGKLRKLENDFLRLEKSSSIFDVRMECQDLEKFSVINRLAKFHGRGQTDISDTAPSHKPSPQRYVTAIPIPRSLPDRVQCLSL